MMRHLIASYRTLNVMTGCIIEKTLPLNYIHTVHTFAETMELENHKLLVL